MKIISKNFYSLLIILSVGYSNLTSAANNEPVTPNHSPEAKALLEFMYRISGKFTLTGQHNYPNTRDRNSQFHAKYVGQTPVVWSTDMGFAEDGDTDSYLARPDILKEAIRQHQLGSIITICWHAVPPTADEPVTFRPPFGAAISPDTLQSVQGRLTEQQYKDLLTPGTDLYIHWAEQVDSVAVYLKQLQDAKVPVLWRPYHEMNGDWFWWGGLLGEYSTRAIYKQIFDRLVRYHKLNNLIWVWSVDRPEKPEMNFSNFYPGNEYLDILALDVYGSDFNQTYYDSLMALSQGKPIVLGEVGNPPSLEILEQQPNWAMWVIWAGMTRNTSKDDHITLVNAPRMLSMEDSSYWKTVNPYREICGLEPLPLKVFDMSGSWVLNEDKSSFGSMGVGNAPYKIKIDHSDTCLIAERTMIVEWGENEIKTDTLKTNGSEMYSRFWNAPRVTTATWNNPKDTLHVKSVITFEANGQNSKMVSRETWTMGMFGKELIIYQKSDSFWGKNEMTVVYDKE